MENATNNYGRLFLLLLGILFFAMFTGGPPIIRVLVAIGVILVVLGTLQATGVTRRIMRNATWISVGLALLSVGAGFTEATSVLAAVSFAAAGGLAASVLLIVRHIFEMDGITVREVVGGLTAYTQVALAFSFLYSGTAVLIEEDFFNNGIAGTSSDFIYFSVVTVTTLGYGDLAPATNVGRSLVVLETLLGQILLIVLVAFLVGRLGAKRSKVESEHPTSERRAGK